MKKKLWLVLLSAILILSACSPQQGQITAGQDPESLPEESASLPEENAPKKVEPLKNKAPEAVEVEERLLTEDEKDRLDLFIHDLENFPFGSAGSSLRAVQLFAQLENDFLFYPQCKERVDQYIKKSYDNLNHPENYDRTIDLLSDIRQEYKENPSRVQALASDAGVEIKPVLQDPMEKELFKAFTIKNEN